MCVCVARWLCAVDLLHFVIFMLDVSTVRTAPSPAKELCWRDNERGVRSLRNLANKKSKKINIKSLSLSWRENERGMRSLRSLAKTNVSNVSVLVFWLYTYVKSLYIELLRMLACPTDVEHSKMKK
jgi:hypothetical protein